MSKSATLINVRFKNDVIDHRLDVKMSPLCIEDEEDIVNWIAFFQHAFDTQRRSGLMPEKERRKIHLVSKILAAVTAEPGDDSVEDTLGYADFLLIARAHSQNEEQFLEQMEKEAENTLEGKKTQKEEETDHNKDIDELITELNKEFDQKMVDEISRKQALEALNPSLYNR